MVRGLVNSVQLQRIENMQPAAKGVSRGDTSFSFCNSGGAGGRRWRGSGDFLTDYKAQLERLSKDEVVVLLRNPELERALLEQAYDGVMTVTGTSKQEVGGETVVTPGLRALHENIPCALSFSGTPDSKTDANSGQISYQATIYCAPELTIPAGCRIAVQQYGVTYRLKYSGESAVYPTHQQLSAVREERA